MPTTSPAISTHEREQMYFYLLAHQLEDSQKKFLTRAIFANQETFLSSVDLPHLITKTNVVANDKNFLVEFTDLLRQTQNLKID